MTTKHTPGPWEASKLMQDGKGVYGIEIGATTPAGHMSVAWVLLGKKPTPREAKDGAADARLLAAAPLMLEALRPLAGLISIELDDMDDSRPLYSIGGSDPITVGDIRRAVAALSAAEVAP